MKNHNKNSTTIVLLMTVCLLLLDVATSFSPFDNNCGRVPMVLKSHLFSRIKRRSHNGFHHSPRHWAVLPPFNDNDMSSSISSATTTTTTVISSAVPKLIAFVTMASSLGVFWSEVAVFQTGCGPMTMPDWLEKSCYLGVLVVTGISVFYRIVMTWGLVYERDDERRSASLATWLLTSSSDQAVNKTDKILLEIAEAVAFLAVLGAVVVLGNQVLNGETMDGLSGIDLDKCRARQAFQLQMF